LEGIAYTLNVVQQRATSNWTGITELKSVK